MATFCQRCSFDEGVKWGVVLIENEGLKTTTAGGAGMPSHLSIPCHFDKSAYRSICILLRSIRSTFLELSALLLVVVGVSGRTDHVSNLSG